MTRADTRPCLRCDGSGGIERWSRWVGSTVGDECPSCEGTGRVPLPTPQQIEDQRRLFEGLRKRAGQSAGSQRNAYVAAEMAFGSDADEAVYAAAVEAGDGETIARLNAEAEARRQRALRILEGRNDGR